MNRSYIIITDSVEFRKKRHRSASRCWSCGTLQSVPEAVDAGTVTLVGTSREKIVCEAAKLLDNKDSYEAMSFAHNPYGDGQSSQRIVKVIGSDGR